MISLVFWSWSAFVIWSENNKWYFDGGGYTLLMYYVWDGLIMFLILCTLYLWKSKKIYLCFFAGNWRKPFRLKTERRFCSLVRSTHHLTFDFEIDKTSMKWSVSVSRQSRFYQPPLLHNSKGLNGVSASTCVMVCTYFLMKLFKGNREKWLCSTSAMPSYLSVSQYNQMAHKFGWYTCNQMLLRSESGFHSIHNVQKPHLV